MGSARQEYRKTYRLGLACAVAGFLLMPAIPAGVLAWRLGRAARRCGERRLLRQCMTIAIVAVLTASVTVLGSVFVERWCYTFERGMHLATLAAAINVYRQEHGTLPQHLESIEEQRYYGDAPHHTPIGLLGAKAGPKPHYLPARKVEGVDFIVAVEAKTRRTPAERGFVVLGDMAWRAADESELKGLLAADDRARAANGIAKRWSDVKGLWETH